MSKNGKDPLLKATIQKNLMGAAYAKFDQERRVVLERVAMVEQENERLRGALNASSNSHASLSAREREMRDAMDGIVSIFDEYAGVERHGPEGLGPAPYNNDAPCYYCTYREASYNKNLVFKLDDVCQWCIHNPYGKLFEKTPTMVALRRNSEGE